MNPDGPEPNALSSDEAGFGEFAKGDLMFKQEIPASLEGETEALFLVGGQFYGRVHRRFFVAGSSNLRVYTFKSIYATE